MKVCRIGDVAKVQSGFAFKSSEFKTSGIRLLRNTNILPQRVYWDDSAFLDEIHYQDFPGYQLNPGDLLISLDRPIISSGIKVARVGDADLPSLLVQRVGRLNLDLSAVDPDYLYGFLQSPRFIDTVSGHEQSLGVPHISPSQVESVQLDLPDLFEQRRIAARLKAQLAEVETARQAAQLQLKDAGALKSKALETLFASIKNWESIGSGAKLQSGYAFKSDTFKTSGVRLLRNANILPGKVYWDDAVFLSAPDSEKHPSYVLNDGDVLISLDRPIISSGVKVARVGSGDLPALLVQRVGRFLIKLEKLDPDYLYAFLQTDLFISEISGHDQSLGVPHISPSQVEAIKMPLPSIFEQWELAKKLNEVTFTWHKAVSALQSQMNDLSKLPKAILAQAFDQQEDHHG